MSFSWPRPDRLTLWIGHYAYPLIGLVFLTTGALEHLTSNSIWIKLLNSILVTGIVLIMFLRRDHDNGHCLACFHRQLNDDAAKKAEAHQRTLNHYHRRHSQFILALLSLALVIALMIWHGPGMLSPMSILLLVLALAPGAYVSYVEATHRRYQRWCPQCRWGRGGNGGWDGPREPSPLGPTGIEHHH